INPPISISANITGLSDADEAIQNNADGIGLFRSEFLYLGKNAPPAEEEQFQIYKQIAKKMSGKKVIIRTADLGYDKLPDYILAEKEQNPALGCRGIRFSFKYIDLFKTQLRAIYRAALYGNIGIMLPMITSLNEVKKTKKLIAEIKAELTKEGQIWGNVDFGIMIETPAAVVLAADFAKQVDFFSIGTNDLESYTLAIDRLSADADVYTDPTYQAILKMIALTAAAARQAGIKVSICGDLAAYPALLEYFINLGIDELSVPPANIPHLRLR
ncbi:MAG: aldolase/citrate lyase family protein, partial [Lachnospiraceae bacterium]|nr:aldolase/citrate lyase family protein [Lachnospiraceae bacterium]